MVSLNDCRKNIIRHYTSLFNGLSKCWTIFFIAVIFSNADNKPSTNSLSTIILIRFGKFHILNFNVLKILTFAETAVLLLIDYSKYLGREDVNSTCDVDTMVSRDSYLTTFRRLLSLAPIITIQCVGSKVLMIERRSRPPHASCKLLRHVNFVCFPPL